MQENSSENIAESPLEFENYKTSKDLPIPNYLKDTYWWAYVHPTSVQVFERQWLVNLILWGNFCRLRDLALDEVGKSITGKNLQVACVYGDFSQQIASRLETESDELHIIDIAPVQLENVNKKINTHSNVYLHHQDSNCMKFDDGEFDNIVVFFLLHEQPESVRRKTVEEVMRVLKPGGKAVFVDYHQPHWGNPLRYVMVPILYFLEPFAFGVWKKEIVDWIPAGKKLKQVTKETLFGGLYQKVVITC